MTTETTNARNVLEHRARQLARPLGDGGDDALGTEGSSSLLVVQLGNERIGIALDHIIEVYRASVLTAIPGARPPVIGVIAWRGRVLTVLDIAQNRVGPLALVDSTRILVIGHQRAAFGVLADSVEDVQDVNMHDAAPVDDVAPARREFIRGMTKDALVVLDPAALISRFAATH